MKHRLHLIEPPDKIAVAANMPSNEILVVSVVYKQSTTTRHIWWMGNQGTYMCGVGVVIKSNR